MALAGRVIASHYAEPLARRVTRDGPLLREPSPDSECLAVLAPGDVVRILDNSRGWAWGYGPQGAVGYVESSALA